VTPDQVNLMRQAAKNLLAHRDAGRKCDPEGVRWAEQLLKQNPEPKVAPETEKDEEHEPR
jgi:hypothetical protein